MHIISYYAERLNYSLHKSLTPLFPHNTSHCIAPHHIQSHLISSHIISSHSSKISMTLYVFSAPFYPLQGDNYFELDVDVGSSSVARYCTHTHTNTHTHTHIHTHTHTHTHTHMHTHIHISIYIYIHIHSHTTLWLTLIRVFNSMKNQKHLASSIRIHSYLESSK